MLSANAPKSSWLRLNLAHALLLSGRRDQAISIYLNGSIGDDDPAKKWRKDITEDFKILRTKGYSSKAMDDIERKLPE